MARPHRTPNPAVDPPSLRHELLLFFSALVIGLVIGVGGSALWHRKADTQTQTQLSTTTSSHQQCQSTLAQVQNQLGQCQRDLKLEQLKPDVVPAPPSFAPSLSVSKPDPSRSGSGTSWPKNMPPAPKPKPGAALAPVAPVPAPPAIQQRTMPTPAITQPAAAPVTLTPSEPAAAASPTVRHLVPQARPAVIPPRSERAPSLPPPGLTPSAPLAAGSSMAIDVGEEKTISSQHKLRLIAVSKRKNGSYCVLAGNGMESIRLASGSSQKANWAGSRVTLTATVQDSNTCRVSVRPD